MNTSFRAMPRRKDNVEVPKRANVLLIHNKLTPFVRSDRDLLAAHFDVEELAIAGRMAPPWQLWKAVRRCDVVYCWFASTHSLLPALVGRLSGRAVVAVVGGYDTANMPEIGYGHQRGGLKKYVARATMRLATRLISHSQFTRLEAIREAGVPGHKVETVYLGLPAKAGSHDTALQDARRVRDLVLTIGNVDRPNLRRKGLEPFVRAAALLPDRRFMIVGAWLDDAVDYLRAIATPNVTFTGYISNEDLEEYLGRCAAYVQASAHEGFGLSLLQAMAAGCVPVVTRAGSLPEVTGDAGVYADSTEPADLVAAIVEGCRRAPAMGRVAADRVAQHFTLAARARGLYAAIDRSLTTSRSYASRVKKEGRVSSRPRVTMHGERDWPLISVVIPTRNERQSIGGCLEAILSQDYPADCMEVLVVDGRSADGTRAEVARMAEGDRWSRMRLLDNPGLIASTALNIGIRAARGGIIARVDGHTIIAPDYLHCCVEVMEETGADNVGGLMRPKGHGYAGECIALATSSRFGVGNSRFHCDESGGSVETVYLGCFRRSIFTRVGLFDERLVRNQDDELNDRIIAAGGMIWLSPRIRSEYYNRSSFQALWRQYHQYGYWKVRVLRRHRHALRLRHLAPAVLVACLCATAVPRVARGAMQTWLQAITRAAFRLAWGTYGGASLLAAALSARRSGWRYLPGMVLAFWCLHLGYGTGLLRGLPAARREDPRGALHTIPQLTVDGTVGKSPDADRNHAVPGLLD